MYKISYTLKCTYANAHPLTQALTPLELVKAARKAWGESTDGRNGS